MKISLDKIPETLDEAVYILKESIETQNEEERLQSPVGLHFGLGMYLRNNWKLWEKETPLVKWFISNFGIGHADDISGTILEALSASLEGREFDVKKHVQIYLNHWKMFGVDPVTGEKNV